MNWELVLFLMVAGLCIALFIVLAAVLNECGRLQTRLMESDSRAKALEEMWRRGCEIAEKYDEVQNRLDSFRDLKHDWNSYGAEPIAEISRMAGYAMCGVPTVVPTSNGGIQFEWHRLGLDVEIEIDSEGKMLGEAVVSKAPKSDGA